MLQNICKQFREQVLQITLKEMELKTGTNHKTISAFENGRSNNINHLQLYIQCCTEQMEVDTFLYNINTVLKGAYHEE